MFPSGRYLFSYVLLAFLVHSCDGNNGFLPRKVDLRITNDLDVDYLVLNLHCKSRDDDLGIHALAPQQFFEFSFRPNIMSTTLFFCRFWWGSESHWFEIYVQKRDTERCDKKCWWMIRKTGPCLLNHEARLYSYCEDWNPKQLQGLNEMEAGNNIARTYNESEYMGGGEKRGK